MATKINKIVFYFEDETIEINEGANDLIGLIDKSTIEKYKTLLTLGSIINKSSMTSIILKLLNKIS